MKGSELGGYLITLEGGEGAGKSTVIRDVYNQLQEKNVDVLMLREPGGTEIGNEIRSVLFDNSLNNHAHPRTEAALFQASRAQIIHEVIKPKLEKGGVILLDRHIDSSIAYQGFAQGIGASQIDRLNKFSTGGLIPDLTLWLDVEPEIGMERVQQRKLYGEDWNRLDDMALAFHKDIHTAYSALHSFDTENRWHRIDANMDPETVRNDVLRVVEDKLIMRGFIEGQMPNPERRG